MAIGPLESFVFPGVFTQTFSQTAGASAAGNPRFPAIIGVGLEQMRVSAFEMIRGSSAVADNLILDEPVTDWIGGTQGTTNKFTVQNFPIVTGDGTGTVATLPTAVIVTVNGDNVAVNSINGLTGEVDLVNVPLITGIVSANYYFKRRDTYVQNEVLTFQADGTRTVFKVKNARIVNGNNGGQSATDSDIGTQVKILYGPAGHQQVITVPVILVKVNNVVATVTSIDGAHGTFTLSAAPVNGATVIVTYFTSLWQDTYDILPAAVVADLVQVGLSADTSDYSIGKDCVLAGNNQIHWGISQVLSTGIYTAGSTPLIDNVTTSLTDTLVCGRLSAPAQILVDTNGNPILDTNGNEINAVGNTSFTLASQPVDGGGTGTKTSDPDKITAYVGPTWLAAQLAGPVTVVGIEGLTVTLETAPTGSTTPSLNNFVYITYYENLIVDDTWTITNQVPGAAGVGRYSVVSQLNGTALDLNQAPGGTIDPVYVTGTVQQVNPLTAIVETITVTFDGVEGFNVTGTKTGTGPTNKGYLGQTYIDSVTGFRVTFSNTGFTPASGKTVLYWAGYPTDPTISQTWFKAATTTTEAIPGIALTVSTTYGGGTDNTGDTVILLTINRSGNEPANGDSYYVTFDKEKTDFTTIGYYTDMRGVITDYGPLSITNKIVVGANLAFINGARSVALLQIQKTTGGTDAPAQSYMDAIDEFNNPLPNGLRPSFIQPMTTDPTVQAYLATSNATQSSIKYRNERTSVVGFPFGTTPQLAIQQCQSLATEKITAVYPEAAVITITDAFGNSVQYLVDGSFLAVAVAGLDCSPATDIATPLTNSNVVGFDRLYRTLDEVTAALVANSGCTVLEYDIPNIVIKMYLTTDLSTVLTRDPRIVEVKHYVQQGLRTNLKQYIGVKNLPTYIPQITRTVNAYFSILQNSQLITAFKGINVVQDANDPSTVDVTAFYSPVFPLNWIIVTLNLNQSL